MEYNEIITARVTAVHRERYGLSCEKGECYGRLKTKEYHVDQAEFPTAGDYVRQTVDKKFELSTFQR